MHILNIPAKYMHDKTCAYKQAVMVTTITSEIIHLNESKENKKEKILINYILDN